jgi:2-dehydropantoate 2-reductase
MEPLYILGAGGIGCAVGHALCAAGRIPAFVDADPLKIDWGRSHGIGVDQLPLRPAAFQRFDDWVPQPGAVVLLCTKCYDNAVVLPRLPPDTILIPIQNGFDPAIPRRPGDVEGIASFISECEPHRTHTHITRVGSLHFGGYPLSESGVMPPRVVELIEQLRRHGSFKVKVVPNILPFKYTKLMYNAAISPLAAAAGLNNGQLLSLRPARRLFFELIRENYNILQAAGVALGKIGPFHPATVQRILAHGTLANLMAWAFYPSLRRTYCSMSGDLPRGRTEIDYYNRHLIDLAGDRPCPRNRRVYEVVKQMERERIAPGLHVLDELRA